MSNQRDATLGVSLQRVLNSFAAGRCYACGWPLGSRASCEPFNCSMRFSEDAKDLAEKEGWHARQKEMSDVLVHFTSTVRKPTLIEGLLMQDGIGQAELIFAVVDLLLEDVAGDPSKLKRAMEIARRDIPPYLSARSETEASNDTFRLDWLHDQLKLTVADAFQWPVIPQDKVSWRAKIDEEIHNKQAEEDALG